MISRLAFPAVAVVLVAFAAATAVEIAMTAAVVIEHLIHWT